MRKKLNVLALAGLACLLGAQAAQANPITFSEVAVGTTDPLIGSVQFFGGAPSMLYDTITDDSWTPGDPYLMSGIDDGTGSALGLFDTFIGAAAQGALTFASVSLDVQLETLLPGTTTITLSAYKAGVAVGSSSLAINTINNYYAMSVAVAGGFDTLYVWDDMDNGGFGEYFHIDNVAYTQWQGGTNPIPEPGTMLLLGTGLTGMIMRRRKKA